MATATKSKMVTAREVHGTDQMCEPCGDCRRCCHYHELRYEVQRLRRIQRQLIEACRELMIPAHLVDETDHGEDTEQPWSNKRARKAIKRARAAIARATT